MPTLVVLLAAATSAAICSVCCARSMIATLQPSWANTLAIARPMPLAPPTTMATWPARCRSISAGGQARRLSYGLAVQLIHFAGTHPPSLDPVVAELLAIGVEIDAARVG